MTKKMYAARDPSDCGVAVIGVLKKVDNEITDDIDNMFDESFSLEEINRIFDSETTSQHSPSSGCNSDDDGFVTESEWEKIFGR